MKRIKVLVVEDEVILAEKICTQLRTLGYETLEPAISYTEAVVTIAQEKPDIALLDIELSGKYNGIALGQKIKDDFNFPFIYLTSHSDSSTIDEAKKTLPSTYLVKPCTKEALYSAIEVALENFDIETPSKSEITDSNIAIKDAFFVKENDTFFKVRFQDILVIKSAHVYAEMLLLDGKKVVIRQSLTSLVEMLSDSFMRIHRQYIVNLDYLNKIEGASVCVQEYKLPIGKRYKEDLLKRLKMI